MINQFIRLSDTKMNVKKAENLMAIIEAKRKDETTKMDMQNERNLFSELFEAFKKFFLSLGKPTIEKKMLKKGSPAKSSDFNNFMTQVNNDIKVAYSETDALANVVVKDFNYSEADRQMLKNSVVSLASQTVDYSFYSDGAKTRSIYAIDDFVDNSKIDYTKISAGSNSAELVVNEGVITLKRTGNTDRSSAVSRVTGIKESIQGWDYVNQSGGYEGLYFGIKGEPRPEGGSWHVMFSSDGTSMYDVGGSEEENMVRRLQMFDNNPDTFWEVELNAPQVTGYVNRVTGKQISVEEFNELVNNELDSPNVNISGGTISTDATGSLIDDYAPISGSGGSNFLSCSMVVNLRSPTTINWISLNPNNFGQALFMDVLSIQTSSDGQKFDELDGFDDYEYSIQLSDKANNELNSEQIQGTISPDKFKYAGMGIWTFSPRTVKQIKFDLRQTRSYIQPYEVLMVTVSQTITTTTTKKNLFGKKVSTDTKTVTNDIEIPYLTGMISGFDVLSLDEAKFSQNVKTPMSGGGAVVGAIAGANAGALVSLAVGGADLGLSIVAGAVIGFVAGLFGSKKTVDVNVSPQTITKQWTVKKYDRSRFAIGIRDINLYSYQFAETSEIVSVPYLSPKPISKVSLHVNESIPEVFYNSAESAGTENEWIKYFISVDDGASWYRISPMAHKLTMSSDGKTPLPEIININSDVAPSERKNHLAYIDTESAVYSVRLKVVLSRPTTLEDAQSYTPVLSKYALQIYPVGGF